MKDEREYPDIDGYYRFLYETENGIYREEEGYPKGGPGGMQAMEGFWT